MRLHQLTGGLILLALTATLTYAADASNEDQQFFEKHISDIVTVKAEPLTNAALEKVLTGKFFDLKLTVGQGLESVLVARVGDKIVQITLPDTTAPIPAFKDLVKPDFKLLADADGKTMEDVLDILYPISGDDAKVKAMRHEGNKWTFVRGKFFEHFDGIIITTDAKGAVTSVSRSLEIK